jgi:GGDEF domain-containing protein
MLLDQVNRLVTVNDVTGLFNLRSMYIELDRQAAYSRRNGVPLCLMIIKLRYEPELRKLLNTNEYNMMLQRMAVICEDALRIEDRIFSIDSRGSIGAVLSCPGEKCSFVKARLKDALEKKDAFDGIINGTIHVDVQIGYLEYDPEKYDNMMEFKAMAEKEVQYDV